MRFALIGVWSNQIRNVCVRRRHTHTHLLTKKKGTLWGDGGIYTHKDKKCLQGLVHTIRGYETHWCALLVRYITVIILLHRSAVMEGRAPRERQKCCTSRDTLPLQNYSIKADSEAQQTHWNREIVAERFGALSNSVMCWQQQHQSEAKSSINPLELIHLELQSWEVKKNIYILAVWRKSRLSLVIYTAQKIIETLESNTSYFNMKLFIYIYTDNDRAVS